MFIVILHDRDWSYSFLVLNQVSLYHIECGTIFYSGWSDKVNPFPIAIVWIRNSNLWQKISVALLLLDQAINSYLLYLSNTNQFFWLLSHSCLIFYFQSLFHLVEKVLVKRSGGITFVIYFSIVYLD